MDTNISKKPKILLAGVVLLIFLVVSFSFIVRRLTPVLERSVTKSTAGQLEAEY